MTTAVTDLANALLEQHVKHELAHFKGAKLQKYLAREVAALFTYADRVTLNRLSSPDQILGVIRRLVIDMDLDAGIPEIAGEMAAQVLNAPMQSHTRLKEILSRDQVTGFVEEALELKQHRERMISGIMAHPVYQELVANVVYQGLVTYLYEDNLITKSVPGVGSMMKFGKKMANKAVPGLDESFERRIKTWLSDSLPGLISRSEAFLHRALTDDEVRDTVMAAWIGVEDLSIQELNEGLGDIQLQEFVVLGYEFWLSFRETPYFEACCAAVVNHLFEQYGDRPIAELLQDVGVTETMVVAEVETLVLPLVDVLREEGYLEEALRRRLSSFYRSAAVKKILEPEA
ncbi:hypothetical protein LPB19_08960 [Marinobacter salinisoli]|uniref:DUF2336 domain-containing protein n=1 Tax=Marinobacter salinisoli TaxID=2769486 RepID=A0ABX7MMD4_9GAMM|nr:hypothetical protein [Marinobacter salinisoli]QSP93366.1 hypothetical protein LPB19_08960 [Marinobacter salinisoli]